MFDGADCAGAAGTAGVETDFGAGVAGSAGFVGGAFGCENGVRVRAHCRDVSCAHLGGHADDETLLLNLIRLDSVVILQNLAGVDKLLR